MDSRLGVFKALGDNTRYAIYLELARSGQPLSTSDIADTLGLHPNTVRPQLERMRDAGLLQIQIEIRSGVGRPQHLYSLADDAPSLGLEPPTYPMLARMLLSLARRGALGNEDAAEIGRDQGRADGLLLADDASCLEAVVSQLTAMGFDPAIAGSEDGETAVIGFCHCPFRELAEAFPELVCSLHQGMIEGIVETVGGGQVESFHSVVHREPCQVTISSR
ncbi:MAG: putative ArsR family transcriptional regulator [Acidimicrobiia bacterium]|nr:putative ArsR family transcriptional regulator [Acidimicrobiia bacterium]